MGSLLFLEGNDMSKNQQNVTFYLVTFVLLAIAITLFVLGFTLGSSIFYYVSGSVLLMCAIILAICGPKCGLVKNPSNAAKLHKHEAKIYIDQLQGLWDIITTEEPIWKIGI